jgi:hypothetical protein
MPMVRAPRNEVGLTGWGAGRVFHVLTSEDHRNATAADQTDSQASRDRYASALARVVACAIPARIAVTKETPTPTSVS